MNTKLIVIIALVAGLGIGYFLPKNISSINNTGPADSNSTAGTVTYKKLADGVEIPASWNVGAGFEPQYGMGLSPDFIDNSDISEKDRKGLKAALLMLVNSTEICMPNPACEQNNIEVYAIPATEMNNVILRRGKSSSFIWSKTTVGGKSVDIIENIDKESKYGDIRTVLIPYTNNYGVVIIMIGSDPATYNRFLETFNLSTYQSLELINS